MINLPDDVSVHVLKGVKLMDIYDKTTGFPRLDEELRKYEVREWARNRNREIENDVSELRDLLSDGNHAHHNAEIHRRVSELLQERDDNTYNFGLAGEKFNRQYEDASGADRDGDYTFSNGTRITRMGSEFDKSLMDSTLVQEVNGETRFRFITEEMVTLYSKKNTDYGDAFIQSLDEDGLLVSKIRIKDKFNRFSQLIKNDALVNDESMRDTLIDLANYAVMTLMWLDENE